VVTESSFPYAILAVNEAWCSMCGFSSLEAEGNTLGMLHGELTDTRVAHSMMKGVLDGESTGAYLVNYRADGSNFLNEVQIVVDPRCAFFAAKLREVSTSTMVRHVKEAGRRCRASSTESHLSDRELLSVLGKRKHAPSPTGP